MTIDLNEITGDYGNNSDDCFFAKNAIKKAILDIKLEYGKNEPIDFLERKSDCAPLDILVNNTAKNLLSKWG